MPRDIRAGKIEVGKTPEPSQRWLLVGHGLAGPASVASGELGNPTDRGEGQQP
ncbi:MAG TPA: hypothetical protein VGR26_10895 [Acidimicrobiales bacterium]|nr:hypothetical protein [Acidimicrobiales bacterium]